ncbi:MAG: DEAD/DEAH box helicase, partial [Planctomycetes bacterium]|nr:DEAD/DEAH box helicase [Planctomycetota bacterium]
MPNLSELQSVSKSESAKACLEESTIAAQAQIPEWLKLPKAPQITDRSVGELLTRLVFSILVDADGTDSGRFEARLKHWVIRPQAPELKASKLLDHLMGYLQSLACRPMAEETRAARQAVLNACLQAAETRPGLFALRVPTGGGKTLAGLAFALKHAAIHHMRRIIVVAPYLSILEQTAMVIRRALGLEEDSETILEHHSMGDWDAGGGKEQSRTGPKGERWDCPIIVTSNIQLLESLFSNKPGRCRKVHQIARSVILLDECQSVPPGLLGPTCEMLNQVTSSWGTTVVMMTATQPTWSEAGSSGPKLNEVREIIPDPQSLYRDMARAQIRWPAR